LKAWLVSPGSRLLQKTILMKQLFLKSSLLLA
jgi:hypothetical protein